MRIEVTGSDQETLDINVQTQVNPEDAARIAQLSMEHAGAVQSLGHNTVRTALAMTPDGQLVTAEELHNLRHGSQDSGRDTYGTGRRA